MKENHPLRDLFAEVGPAQAADGLEAAVLARLAPKPIAKHTPEAPFMPPWTWGIAVGLVAALFLWPQSSSFTWNMPTLPNVAMTSSMRWTLAALACGALLFALDSVLRIRSVRTRHA
ncbi:MAG: hypothetical protein JNM62_14945 [Flavobacteriales bacterium]|nr:hypothetical protein [Flavobacteriales bacterium]